ncbi:lamin tail domain-containing protein, partial [Bacteroidota bacterium]
IMVFVTTSFSEAQQSLFINEFMAKNDSFIEDDEGNFSDWIELYNSSASEVDLSGFYLTDDKDTLNKWKIPSGTNISAKGYMIFWADGNDKNLHTNFKLSADGETLALVNPNGITKVDTVKFGVQESDVSYGRVKDGDPNWIYFEEPTFNAPNQKSSSNTLPLVINELMASNSKTIQDETGAFPDWIELYNNSDEEIDISGFYITDEPYGYPSQWRIPAGTIIPANGFLIIWCDSDPKDGPYHTNFKLSKDGDSVAIYAQDGKTIIDMISYGEQETDVSYGRKTDGEESWALFNIPTPGATNNSVGVDEINNYGFSLNQNYPNPFSESTNISFVLKKPGNITLSVFDIFGREVARLFEGELWKGDHNFTYNRNALPAGVYFNQLRVGNDIIIKKIIIE